MLRHLPMSEPSSTERPTLHSLQIGRGLAALTVVLHHCAAIAGYHYSDAPDWVKHGLYLGYLGVEYFFVLSGFILSYVIEGTPRDAAAWRHYYRARLVRVYVPYYPIALALLAIAALFPQWMPIARESYSMYGTLTLLPSEVRPILGVAWTLQQEIVFYALLALCHFVFGNWRYIFLWVIPIAALYGNHDSRSLTVLMGPMSLEFLLGAAAFHAYHRGLFVRARTALVLLGFVILAATIMHFYGASSSDARIMGAAGFALLMLGMAYYERDYDFSRFSPALFLGAISYALYLTHVPLFAVMHHVPFVAQSWQMMVLCFLIGSIALAAAYHLIYEKPALKWLRRRWLKNSL